MKKFLAATAGAVALLTTSIAAQAADLPQKTYAPPPAVVVAPVYDWTGFYLGLNGGGGQVRNCLNWLSNSVFPAASDGCSTRSGGMVGGQLGYRCQMGAAVFGLEAQGDWASMSNTWASVVPAFSGLATTVKTDGIGLFTGQIGYTWGPGLLYVKGGGAVTSNTASWNGTSLIAPGGIVVAIPFTAATASATRWGGTLGVGFEYLFTPNWSIGVEYNHLWMGTSNNSFNCGAIACGNIINNNISQTLNLGTLRLDYKFGGPVVARY